MVEEKKTNETNLLYLLSVFSNSINELCVPLCLPEVKTLDLSKNSVENVSADFLTGCPKLETLNVSMNKICKYATLDSSSSSKPAPLCTPCTKISAGHWLNLPVD